MELNYWYDFFFENHGLCPHCKQIMTMHVGCTNMECILCQGTMEADRVMKIRITAYNNRRLREQANRLKAMEYGRKRNLDKRQEKQYIKIDD